MRFVGGNRRCVHVDSEATDFVAYDFMVESTSSWEPPVSEAKGPEERVMWSFSSVYNNSYGGKDVAVVLGDEVGNRH